MTVLGCTPLYAIGQAQQPNTLDAVVVTGTRGDTRTATSSPVPIDVIGGEQLQLTGKSNLREALSAMLPSLNTTQRGGAPIATVSLRGLGSAYVLFLVNGKRRHNNAMLNWGTSDNSGNNPVDLEQIPISAIDHIEILRDGASAQYGSDAIAGVVNIILKRGDSEGSAISQYGRSYAGDGRKLQQQINKGFPLGDGGFFNATLEALNQDSTNRNEGVIGNVYPRLADGSDDPREASSPAHRYGTLNGTPSHESYQFAYNSELPLQNGSELYSFGTYGTRHMGMGFTFRRPSSTEVLTDIFPDGYYPYYSERVKDYQAAFGSRGELGDWHWDLSTTYGRNDVKSYVGNDLNPSLGPDLPQTSFFLSEASFSQWTNNLDLTRSLEWRSRPLQLSWGLEHRYERYRLGAGEANAWRNGGYIFTDGVNAGSAANVGARGVPSTTDDDAGSVDRNTYAGYLELGLDATQDWYLGLAGRFESFDDIGQNSLSGKLTTRYAFSPALALRSTISSGFRAPSLSQQGYGQTQNYVSVVDGIATSSQIKVAKVGSELARALGAQDLKPEKSTNLSLGLVYKPSAAFSLTLDAYQIDIRDRIVRTSALSGDAVSQLLEAAGLSGIQSVQYFTNGVDTRTRGLDFVGDYVRGYGHLGVVTWSLAFGLNQTRITNIKATPSALAALDPSLVYFDRQQQLLLTRLTPRDKLVLGAHWAISRWTLDLGLTRYGEVTTPQVNAADDRRFGAKWITRLDIDYAISDAIDIAIGADNLFDIYPDRNGLLSIAGFNRYGTSPFGSDGGYYYARINMRF
ncbi:MAG: TonB-dependent receptor [Pseudomonas sp.]